MGRSGVSVVVPTKGRPEALRRCLHAVALATAELGAPAEVIVVDDGSDQTSRAAAEAAARESHCEVRYAVAAAAGAVGSAQARNLGIRLARFDVIAFTDDDVLPHRDWLTSALRRIRAEDGLAGTEGMVVPTAPDGLDGARARVVANLDGGAFLTANLVVRRDALRSVGGFRSLRGDTSVAWNVPFREDTDLALRIIRAVGPIAFEPASVVLHPVEEQDLRGCLRTARYFVVDGAFARLHPDYVPTLLSRPAARLRIRLACLSVVALPFTVPRATRRRAVAILALCAGAVDLQVEHDLRRAGIARSLPVVGRDLGRRLGRSASWCLVAGTARITGELLVGSGMVPLPGLDTPSGSVDPG